MEPRGSMPHSRGLSNNPYPFNPVPRPCVTYLNEDDFYSVRLLASRQTPKLEEHSWSAVHDCLFNTFPATLYIYMDAYSPIRNPGDAMPW